MNFSQQLNDLVQAYIQENKAIFADMDPEKILVTTETIGEVIEKLLILNIRIWQLEDQASLLKQAGDLNKYATLKTKLDSCFKIKRPALVSAIDILIKDAIEHPKTVDSTNVKIYS